MSALFSARNKCGLYCILPKYGENFLWNIKTVYIYIQLLQSVFAGAVTVLRLMHMNVTKAM